MSTADDDMHDRHGLPPRPAPVPGGPETAADRTLWLRFALAAAFRNGWEAGAWYVSDAVGGPTEAQRAAADRDRRRADSDRYVAAAAPGGAEPATDREGLRQRIVALIHEHVCPGGPESVGLGRCTAAAAAVLAALVEVEGGGESGK